jgi:DNA repair exonuclease SbcCD ATPase subunit
MRLYDIAKPLLFSLPAETANGSVHTLLETVQGTPIADLMARRYTVTDDRLAVEALGQTFDNPVGVAAGFDKNATIPNALASLGFGFAEVGGVTAVPQDGNARPRMFRLREDEATLSQAITTAAATKEAAEARLKATTEAHDGAKQALGRAQRQNRRRRELLAERQDLEVERAKAEAAASEAQQTLAECGEDDLDRAKAALSELQEQFRKERWLATRYKELDDREQDLDAEAKELAGDLEAARRDADLMGFDEDELDERERERGELRTKVLGLQADVRNAEKSLKESICHACGRPLDGAHIEEIEQEKAEAKAELDKEQPLLESLEAHIAELTRQGAEAEKVRRQITRTEVQLEQVQGTLDETRQAIAELDEPASAEAIQRLKDVTLPEAQAFYDEQVALRDRRQRAEKSLAQARHRIGALDKDLGNLGEVPEEVDEEPLQASLDAAADQLEKDKAAYHDARSELQFAEHRLGEVREKLAAAEKAAERRRHLEARKTAAGQLVKYLRKNRDRFLMEVWDGVMAYASHFAESCTGGAITSVGRSAEGKFTYVEDGQEMPVEAGSGAQRSLMGLGVQMALAQMLPSPFDGVLLDEPTADMDEERSMALAMMLATANGQVLMVSHREFDGSVATHAINLGEAA